MTDARVRAVLAARVLPFLLGLGGCGGDDVSSPGDPSDPGDPGPGDNVAPTVAALADRSIVRNTLNPRSLELELELADPDGDSLRVIVSADDASVLATVERSCAPGSCTLTLTPSAETTAEATIDVAVDDGRGGVAETSFMLRIEPVRVTSAAEDGAGSLRRTIADAQAGDVIAFDAAGAFATPQTIPLLAQIVLDESVTIEGTGASNLTISGSNVSRVFKIVDGADVTLRALTISDGMAGLETVDAPGGPVSIRLGGGAFVGTGSRLTIEDGVISGNAAPVDGLGGGLANLEGTLVLRDCAVVANSAAGSGGGVLTLSLGGAQTTTTIEGGVVEGNTAQSAGGGVANMQGNLLVRAPRIAGNSAGDGGGISSSGSLVIEPGCELVGNEATGRGGGIFASAGAATVRGATIADNTAAQGGGVYSSEGTWTLETVTIEENDAMKGGGIHSHGTLHLVDSRIAGNAATTDESNSGGGGVLNAGQATIVACDVVENRTLGSGGGLLNGFADGMTVTDSRIIDNVAARGGGGVLNGGELSVAESTIGGNRGNGEESNIGAGGGIANRAVVGNATATISGSVIEGNVAATGGGLSNSPSTRAALTLNGCQVLENTSTAHPGGGIRSTGELVLNATTVAGNVAPDGGGISWFRQMTIQGGTIADNHADGDGGGIHNNGANIVDADSDATVSGTSIGGNTAANGAGIFAYATRQNRVKLVIGSGTEIAANTAAGRGGGIYQRADDGNDGNAMLVMSGTSVHDNVSMLSGGGVYSFRGALDVSASTIEGNATQNDGGGIFSLRSTVEIGTGAMVAANESGGSGGGIFTSAGSISVAGTTCVIRDNAADADGDGSGRGGGIFYVLTDMSSVPAGSVCANSPDNVSAP